MLASDWLTQHNCSDWSGMRTYSFLVLGCCNKFLEWVQQEDMSQLFHSFSSSVSQLPKVNTGWWLVYTPCNTHLWLVDWFSKIMYSLLIGQFQKYMKITRDTEQTGIYSHLIGLNKVNHLWLVNISSGRPTELRWRFWQARVVSWPRSGRKSRLETLLKWRTRASSLQTWYYCHPRSLRVNADCLIQHNTDLWLV